MRYNHQKVKKTAKLLIQQNLPHLNSGSGNMYAFAFTMNNNGTLVGGVKKSGGGGRDTGYTRKPWDSYTRKEPWLFTDCAEAKTWSQLQGLQRRTGPYYLVTFNGAGDITGPCRNCIQWVHQHFVVIGPQRYNPASKQASIKRQGRPGVSTY